mgnify:CR=1 FL=1
MKKYLIEFLQIQNKIYWLIPNNPNVYDAIGAFKELKEIDKDILGLKQ